MDDRFVAAVETSFRLGLESRAAARATVRVMKQRLTEEEAIKAAIHAAWCWLWQKEGDVPFSAVVARVRTQYPGVDPARIRNEFERWRRSTLFADGGGAVGQAC